MSDADRSYAVAFSAGARRNLNALPETAATALVELVFGALARDPGRIGKPLTGQLLGYHSVRRGGYRVIYRIDDEHRSVFILRVAHRRDAYRPR